MVTQKRQEAERYFYRSATKSKQHRNRVSVYFVERYADSNLVARIESLGLVHATINNEELTIERLRRRLVIAGSWQPTISRHHVRIKLAPSPAMCK